MTRRRAAPHRRFRAAPRAALGALSLVLLAACPTFAQESWVYSPYRVRVWLAVSESPRLGRSLAESIRASIANGVRAAMGSTWRTEVEFAPESIRVELSRGLDQVDSDRMLAVAPKGASDDKIMLVVVDDGATGFAVAAREWDTRTRSMGSVIRHDVPQRERIGESVSLAVARAFVPIARIDDVKGNVAVVRFRGSGLAIDAACPASPRIGQCLRVVTRQNDRYGNPKPNGLRSIEWTLLRVNTIEQQRVECEVHSINRGYLAGRSNSRLERYALGVLTPFADTELELRSKESVAGTLLKHDADKDGFVARDEVPVNLAGVVDRVDLNRDGKLDPAELEATKRPLVGYDIYFKDPTTEETGLLGQTDWRGRLRVPPAKDGGMRLLYVRSGGMLLARLPIVPGQTRVAAAELTDDEKRLQAESLVRGIQGNLVDLVARRELIAARIRKKVAEGKRDEAQSLVDQFRALPTLADMRQRLDAARQQTVTKNPKIQARIDQMFAEADGLLIKYVDPNLVEKLAAQVAQPAK
ncbi:MAG: hypothetical protein FJ297_18890 [Planctomycetes bacterium]|nr:hypothetical protein [Planctomycetota bacterium]